MIVPTMRGFLGRASGAAPSYDTNAQSWFDAVEATGANFGPSPADILTNKAAFNAWFVGVKADGIWSAIKTGCFLRGPRTRTGAMVPFVGSAPTSFNFVDADYNRLTGLKGNGTDKYLDTNRANNADPQNDQSFGFWVAEADTGGTTKGHMGAITDTTSTSGTNAITRSSIVSLLASRSRNSTAVLHSGAGSKVNFHGISRSASAGYTLRVDGVDYPVTQASQTPTATNIGVFRAVGFWTVARKSFYYVGESLSLSALDSRLTTLFGALV